MTEIQQAAAGAAAVAAATQTVDRLARIETKLDGITDDRQSVRAELDAHAGRLDRVERFMWLAVGMSLAAGLPNIAAAIQKAAGA